MAIENNNLYYTFLSSSPVNVHFIAESEFEEITKNLLEYIKNLRKSALLLKYYYLKYLSSG